MIDRHLSLRVAHFSEVNRKRLGRFRDPGWKPVDWYTALVGETGELAGAVKRVRRFDEGLATHWDPTKAGLDRATLVAMMLAETADVIIYLDLLAFHANAVDWWYGDERFADLVSRAEASADTVSEAYRVLRLARGMGLMADRLARHNDVLLASVRDVAISTFGVALVYAPGVVIEQALVDKFNQVSDTNKWPERIE